MKHLYRQWVLFLVVVILVPCQSGLCQAKKNIVILATGGTIAGAAPTGTQVGYTSGQVGNRHDDQCSSWDQGAGQYQGRADLECRLAGHVVRDPVEACQPDQRADVGGDVDGIVITHGTDTMEESAYFLNLTAKTDKPVVLVGSMRPSTAVSADGPLNLYNAVAVAADPRAQGRGVLVVMNDHIHAAHSLTKTSTTDVQTFMSPIRGLVGVVSYGKCDFYNTPPWKHTSESEFDVSGVTKLPRVDIIYADVDMSPDLIDASVSTGAKGIVIAGVGNGNMTQAAVEAAARAVKKGVVVVRSSRVTTGLVGRNVELNDDKLGFIASDELNPQKSRILLSLALLKPRSPSDIQQLFMTY